MQRAEITDETMSLRARSICAGVRAKSLQSCPTRDHSPPDSSVHGILQASIPEWVAISSSRVSSQLRNRTLVSYISCIGRWVPYC